MTSDPARASASGIPSGDGERGVVYYGDNLPILRKIASQSIDLIYTDPPFNTGKKQARTQLRTVRDPSGDRTGFKGQRYRSVKVASRVFEDDFDDYLAFLEPRLEEAHRVLSDSGSLYLHLDYREVHYAKVLLDGIFGRDCFLNEVIWAYDYGGRTKKKWPAKHDNILVYVRDPEQYFFNVDEVERIPYHGPRAGRAGESSSRKAANGYLVAHDRADERQGAHGISNPETAWDRSAHRAGVLQARRHGAGLLRGQRHAWGSRVRAWSAIRANRRQP